MAAAVLGTRRQNQVNGARRQVTWDLVTFTSSGDTLVIPGMKRLETIDFTPNSNVSFGFTTALAAGVLTITIASAGTVAGLFSASGI